MALIVWRDELSVGVPEMDAQHKRLIQLINDLHDAMREGKGKETMGSIIEGLKQYTIAHFSKEEALMKTKGYPGLSKQVSQHSAFVAKVSKFQDDFSNGRATISLDVMSFLRDWLTHHIMQEDKAYGPHVGNKTAAQA